jgi:hypothetical protein
MRGWWNSFRKFLCLKYWDRSEIRWFVHFQKLIRWCKFLCWCNQKLFSEKLSSINIGILFCFLKYWERSDSLNIDFCGLLMRFVFWKCVFNRKLFGEKKEDTSLISWWISFRRFLCLKVFFRFCSFFWVTWIKKKCSQHSSIFLDICCVSLC